jgi:hypothetical protein
MRLSTACLYFLSLSATAVNGFTSTSTVSPMLQSKPSIAIAIAFSTRGSSSSSLFLSSSATDERTPEEEAFFAKTKQLCEERNIPLAKIKNARDLASAANSNENNPIIPNRLFRTGRVSDATTEDIHLLHDELGIRTLVDLRSPTELKDDMTLDREEVFGDYTNLIWDERDHGSVKELRPGEPRIKEKKKSILKKIAAGAKKGASIATTTNNSSEGSDLYVAAADLAGVSGVEEDDLILEDETQALLDDDGLEENDLSSCGEDVDCKKKKRRFVQKYGPGTIIDDKSRGTRKERHFVSIMNELKYVKGTLSKVSKRDIAKTIIKSPGALVSKRVRSNIKTPFLDKINAGGLPMLNDLLSRYGAPGIRYVLDLCKDTNRHPIAFYCTAGKDRTGMIAAIILAACGVPEEDIIEDYSLSANVYAEMGDNQAMVGALSQRSLDPKTFLGAPPHVMRDTLNNMKETYGSVEGYLDFIGFNEEDRQQLRAALME